MATSSGTPITMAAPNPERRRTMLPHTWVASAPAPSGSTARRAILCSTSTGLGRKSFETPDSSTTANQTSSQPSRTRVLRSGKSNNTEDPGRGSGATAVADEVSPAAAVALLMTPSGMRIFLMPRQQPTLDGEERPVHQETD